MADGELLERIEGHMARGNELMELIREDHALNRREHELNRAAMHSTRDAVRSLAAAVEKQAEASDAMLASLGDMRDSIQANTRAVLHVLDELRGPGPAGAPA
jgi:methyl-accepting chemotaxis protein